MLKLPRKPFARGLSEIVASLRRVEEEKLDDDLEALREAEDEQEGMATTKRLSSTNADAASHPRQPHPGGLDDEAMYDSPVEDALDRNGKPLPVYKKKAPKRTTRRVNIKPTRVKRPADIELGNETSGGAQSQIQQSETAELDANSEEDDNQSNHLTGATKTREKEGTVKKAVRKVNELAHANFQRLKLRNKGSKGGPGYNSKFRRRR
ncbi:hypothetical protein CDD83_784 [Cordyceps sp. RAO-2017]|nr:hypothetical protein CDD83_784 [Cordyceps sp. RAO-2017]